MGNRSDETTPSIPPADGLEWRDGSGDRSDLAVADREMALRGLERARTLVQLHRGLPVGPDDAAGLAPATTRAFDRVRDAEALVEVNNAAFSWHPEQGGWDLERLDEALTQPWVDPSGILVHDPDPDAAGGPIDGFCWTRVHRAGEPEADAVGLEALGEIWVIAAHPSRHGTGLGSGLVLAGLEHLATRGLDSVMLYTEDDNHAAVRMYERLGFAVQRRRGGYLPQGRP